MTDMESNQQVAEQICNAARWNGTEFQQGDWVALLDGKAVAVARDLETTLKALRALDPDPQRGMVFEVGPPVVDVIRLCVAVPPGNRGWITGSNQAISSGSTP
jgi:hypothetical protein